MNADRSFIQPGATVWLLDRARVRSGAGPEEVVVAEVFPQPDGRLMFRTRGTRGMYGALQAFQTEGAARVAWQEQADAELMKEMARFNIISSRLSAWQRK